MKFTAGDLHAYFVLTMLYGFIAVCAFIVLSILYFEFEGAYQFRQDPAKYCASDNVLGSQTNKCTLFFLQQKAKANNQ